MFKRLEDKPNFPEIEKKIACFWQKNNVLEKYLKKNEGASERFSFLDGPITANNPMGVHHAWGRSLKDIYQRYKNMCGFEQRFQNGFDNQGLWVEVEVEKKLGFKSKKDIEDYGISEFVARCKEHTLHFAEVQTEQSKRLGYFMDWDNSYYTMSDENNFAIWHFLKKCHENGWIYKGEDVVPWCPRCGTAISQHEILTADYKELSHKSVFIKYRLQDKDNEHLLVWTTTPWTLPANVAIAVSPEINYVKIKTAGSQVLILAKARVEEVIKEEYQILEEFLGKTLVGLKYLGFYDHLPIVKESIKEHPVVAWKQGVLEQEGTGMVHVSTGSGPEDYQLGKEIGLPVFPVIGEDGSYVGGYDSLSGKRAQDIAPEIVAYLKEKDFLYYEQNFTHRYPICWRCNTELLFRLVDEWYISMDELRHRMMAAAKKIRWIPEFGLKMELDWLKNMHDWLISKKRYWGLSLPIWECECGHFEVIGSKKELKEKAIEGWDDFEVHSPHRPRSDKVKIKCPKCGQTVSRIADVGNPWLDAGIVSFSTMKYLEDKSYWKKWFPADLVLECFPGQFKNWFYSLIAMAAVLENTNPFENLLGHALVRDEKGREMHKSQGNAIDFDEAAEKMGVDVMRWLYARQNPVHNINFGYSPADKIKKQFLFVLWNCYKFFINYAGLEFKTEEEIKGLELRNSENILDKWIFSRLNKLIELMTEKLENYDNASAVLAIEDFVVNDFSTWYIRRSRSRIGSSRQNIKDKKDCYATMFQVLLCLTKLMAPIIPFTTEKLWQSLGQDGPVSLFASHRGESQGGSVHLQDWPRVNEKLVDEKLEEKMAKAREVCSLGHSLRREAGIKVRQPLAMLKFSVDKTRFAGEEELINLIKEELNLKEATPFVQIDARKGFVVAEQGDIRIALDIRLTPELEEQGLVREIIRQIQQMRREAGYQPIHKIMIQAWGSESLNNILLKNSNLICQETIAKKLKVKEKKRESFDFEGKADINSQELWLAIKKSP